MAEEEKTADNVLDEVESQLEADAENEVQSEASTDLSESERQLQQEIAEMREQMKMFMELVGEMHRLETMRCMNRFMELSQEAEQSRSVAFQLPTVQADRLLRGTGKVLSRTAASIKNLPNDAREAVKKGAHKTVNGILNRIAAVYDKGIDALARQRASVLARAYVEKDSVADAMKNFGEIIKTAQENNRAVFERTTEDRRKYHAPVFIRKNREGEFTSHFLPTVNVIPALQMLADRGITDTAFLEKKQVDKNRNITVKEGVTPIAFVFFDKDNKPFTEEFYHRSDLEGKGVPQIVPETNNLHEIHTEFLMDKFAKECAALDSFQAENYAEVALQAKDRADKNFNALNALCDLQNNSLDTIRNTLDESARRMEDFKHVKPYKEGEATNPKRDFQLLMAEAFQQSSDPSYIARAAEKALSHLNWDEKKVKAAIADNYSTAAFQAISREGQNVPENVLATAKYRVSQTKKKEAAR